MRRGGVCVLAIVAGCSWHRGAALAVSGDGADGPADTRAIDSPDGPPAAPVTTSFGERSTSVHTGVTTDTWLESANVTATHGTDIGLYEDASPTVNGLLRFDLSAIPTSATVSAVELDLVTTTDSLESGMLETYAVLEDWDEATASWSNRTASMAWTDAGASGPGSRGSTLVGTVFPGVDLTPYSFALDLPTVQGWVTTPASNHGLVLISTSPSGNGVTFSSSNDTLVDARPQLRVTYTP